MYGTFVCSSSLTGIFPVLQLELTRKKRSKCSAVKDGGVNNLCRPLSFKRKTCMWSMTERIHNHNLGLLGRNIKQGKFDQSYRNSHTGLGGSLRSCNSSPESLRWSINLFLKHPLPPAELCTGNFQERQEDAFSHSICATKQFFHYWNFSPVVKAVYRNLSFRVLHRDRPSCYTSYLRDSQPAF